MTTWKKTLSGVLSAAMLMSICTVGVSAEELDTGNPGIMEPGVVEPNENPNVEEPNAVEPDAVEPSAVEPDAVEPSVMNLSATEPKASVGSLEDLKAALANTNVTEITLTGNIAIPAGPENNLVLDRPITINGGGFTLTKTFNDVPDTSDATYGDYEEVFYIESSGVTIKNVTVAGLASGMKDEAAIWVAADGTSSAPIVIENCEFIGADSATEDSGGSGIITQSFYGDYLQVKNSTFTNVKHGMWFNGINNASITGNTLNGVRYTGIRVEPGSSDITITDNTMTDVASANHTTPEFACGIFIGTQCTKITLSGNNITLHKGATNGKEVVNPDYDKFAPKKVDLSQAGGVTLSGNTFSGNVDPRTYTVTDSEIHRLFGTLLEGDQNPWTVAGGKKLSFGIVEFSGITLDNDTFYTIQQENPALKYAYGEGEFPTSIKTKTYKGSDLDKLYFMISEAEGDISFKVAPTTALDADVTDWTGVPTYTYVNNVTFNASEDPAETVIEVKPNVNGTTAAATVPDEAVTEAVASADTNTTLEITATTTNSTVKKTELTLSGTAVGALVDIPENPGTEAPAAQVKDVVITTNTGTITLSSSALEEIAKDSDVKDHGIVLEVTQETPSGSEKAVISVSVKSNNNNVTIADLEKPITISFYIGPDLQNPVLLYKDSSSGALKNIESSTYDPVTGIITGTTKHLSTFAAVDAMDVTPGGIGHKVTLTPGKTGDYLTIQVTNGGANAIYTVQASAPVVIYVTTGTVLSVWETTGVPTFDESGLTPGSNPAILADRQSIS